jgi:hypothetical protein
LERSKDSGCQPSALCDARETVTDCQRFART